MYTGAAMLQCGYSNEGRPTKFPTNSTNKKLWRLKTVFQQMIQNEHKSVAFEMYNLIT